MLIKATNQCGRGCSHCMEGSLPGTSQHMSMDTYDQALWFTWEMEEVARATCGYNFILLSGGECTEHPEIVEMIRIAYGRGFNVILISNGMWLDGPLKEEILGRFPNIFVQVTYDKRFYPEPAPPHVEDKRISYQNELGAMMPLGRFRRKSNPEVPTHRAPGSFNFRSLAKGYNDVRIGVAMLRMRAVAGKGNGHCTPSISYNGDFVAGETNFCWKLGTVHNTMDEINKAVREMKSCDRCGLEKNLDQRERRALGLSTLYVPGEP